MAKRRTELDSDCMETRKTSGRLRNCHRPEETEMLRQPNARWHLGLNLEQVREAIRENQRNSKSSLEIANRKYQD